MKKLKQEKLNADNVKRYFAENLEKILLIAAKLVLASAIPVFGKTKEMTMRKHEDIVRPSWQHEEMAEMTIRSKWTINPWSSNIIKNFVTITNQVELTVEDRVLNEASRLLAQNMAQTIDEVTRDVLASTSSVLQCSNGVNGNTPTELTKADIDTAVTTLLGNDAEMISEVVVARDAFGTAPVRPAFWGYIDTDCLDDLEAVSNFIHASQYPNQQSVLDSEWGATGNVRWLFTSVGSVSSASPAVYNNFIIGKEAYAVVHLRSETGEFYVEPLGSAGSADPLHQRGSVGWQHPFVARILNDAFMINLEATHS